MKKCIDDSALWDDNVEQAFWHVCNYIYLCGNNGMIFNRKKFHFAKDVVDFAGFTITESGIKPTESMLAAIKNFPTPNNITGIRSFFGLMNQVNYALANSVKMQPFRELLKKGNAWYWDDVLENLFVEAKESILNDVEKGIRNFEVNRPTCLWTDWSKSGMGFVLMQKHCKCDMQDSPTCCKSGWKLVLAGSRFTQGAETRYAPIEGEALAVVWALNKCRMFVLGCPNLLVVVDHKPLVKIFGDKSLESIDNPRLFNFKEKTLRYDFKIKYIPGKENFSADACSRYPVESSNIASSSGIYEALRTAGDVEDENYRIDTENSFEYSIIAALGTGSDDGDIRILDFSRVKEVAPADEETQQLLRYVTNGFPANKDDCPTYVQKFWNIRESLSSLHGVVLYGTRVVVPKALRKEALENLHAANQGTTGMKARAQACVYWPGINGDIKNRRLQCRGCNEIAPSNPSEPIIFSASPEYPFDHVVTDYFSLYGYKYLLYADRYSGWITIVKPGPTEGNASYLKKRLRELFATFGVPNELSSDGGPPYNSHEMGLFYQAWGVTVRKSSSYYPQSNGRAELAVKVSKRLLMDNCDANGSIDNDKVARALLQYRNTPLQDINLSPAQILFGRMLRDHTPTLPTLYQLRPEWRIRADERENALSKRNAKIIESYDKHTRTLPELNVNDHVAVQNQHGSHSRRWSKTGKVVEKHDNRQYTVRMDGSRRVTLRNRKFLKQIKPVCADPPLQRQSFNEQSRSNTGGNVPITRTNDVNMPPSATRSPILPPSPAILPTVLPSSSHITPVAPVIRRSTRVKEPRKTLSIDPSKKSYDVSSSTVNVGRGWNRK